MAHRSQLLYRLVECLFWYTYDYGIVIRCYLPITFAINWTYSGSLHVQPCTLLRKDQYLTKKRQVNIVILQLESIHLERTESWTFLFKELQMKLRFIGKVKLKSYSNLTCKPANDVWLRTRSATSCALFPLIFATTYDKWVRKQRTLKVQTYRFLNEEIRTVNWPSAFRCASNLSRISCVVSSALFLLSKDLLLATRTAYRKSNSNVRKDWERKQDAEPALSSKYSKNYHMQDDP